MGKAHQNKGNPQQALDAYASGIVDGEGCIRLCKGWSKRDKKFQYVIRVTVTQKDYRIPLWLSRRYGGNFWPFTAKPINLKCYRWTLSGQTSKSFLKRILPFLILKKEQAELALEVLEKGPRSGYPMSKSYVEYCERVFVMMKHLKAAAETESPDGKSRSDSPNCKDGKLAESVTTTDRLFSKYYWKPQPLIRNKS